MKNKLPTNLEKLRIDHPFYEKQTPGSIEGCFKIPCGNEKLLVISANSEEWEPVKNYETLYEVSNKGEVRALPRTRIVNGIKQYYKMHVLLPGVNGDGYKRVPLYKNGKRKQILVHRLVAGAFIANPNNYPVVNHRNGEKGDICVLNLEWCTREHNAHHAIENGFKGGFKADDIKKIKAMFNDGMTIKQIATQYERDESTISDYIFERHRSLKPEKPSRYKGMPLWDHVSISLRHRYPTWEETCFIKNLFFKPDETAIQFHPPEKDYINVGKTVLHIWKPWRKEIELPPKWMLA